MIILSKRTSIILNVLVNSLSRGQERLSVEINDDQVIFRGRSCRTEVSLHQARNYLSSISNCIWVLIPDINGRDCDRLVSEIYEIVRGTK